MWNKISQYALYSYSLRCAKIRKKNGFHCIVNDQWLKLLNLESAFGKEQSGGWEEQSGCLSDQNWDFVHKKWTLITRDEMEAGTLKRRGREIKRGDLTGNWRRGGGSTLIKDWSAFMSSISTDVLLLLLYMSKAVAMP